MERDRGDCRYPPRGARKKAVAARLAVRRRGIGGSNVSLSCAERDPDRFDDDRRPRWDDGRLAQWRGVGSGQLSNQSASRRALLAARSLWDCAVSRASGGIAISARIAAETNPQ